MAHLGYDRANLWAGGAPLVGTMAPEGQAPGTTRDTEHDARSIVATLALGAAVGLGVASMLPDYLSGSSIASHPDLVVAHAIPLGGWLLAAALVATGRLDARRLGSLLGLGIGAVELGLLLSDAGTVFAGGAHLGGAGLVLAALEWLLATGASALVASSSGALSGFRDRHRDDDRQSTHYGPARAGRLGNTKATTAVGILAALAAAGLYAPPWDRLVVDLVAVGRTTVVTAGNAFANPAAVIAGNVVVIVSLVALPLVALSARSRRLGGAMLAGGVVAAASQVVSALVQWREPVPPSEFGLSTRAAVAAGFHVSSGFTPVFYLFSAAVAVLAVVAVLELVERSGRRTLPPLGALPDVAPRRAFSPTPHY
ncbi:MAG: hypothetical protein ACYCXY_13035 [Acidimicrobiales bacterium]